jgi:hypothetical protein
VGIGIEKVMLGNFWNCHFLFSYVYVNSLKVQGI